MRGVGGESGEQGAVKDTASHHHLDKEKEKEAVAVMLLPVVVMVVRP